MLLAVACWGFAVRLRNIVLVTAASVVLLAANSFTARADYASAGAWFSSLPPDQRALIQAELLLTGRYVALVDSQFGASTYDAVTDIQMQLGVPMDGVLTDTQQASLLKAALTVYTLGGFEKRRDVASGISLPAPYGILAYSRPEMWGTNWRTVDDKIEIDLLGIPQSYQPLPQLFAQLTQGSDRTVAYSYFPGDWFVANGTAGGRNLYVAFTNSNGISQGFSVTWSYDESIGQVIADYLGSALLHPEAIAADATLTALATANSAQVAGTPPAASPQSGPFPDDHAR
jgi:peptidoglycan hydrolase-like protein with peptidoglycan-binding domain